MRITQLFSSRKRSERQAAKQAGATLYQSVLKGALAEDLYRSGIGEDTFEGRFEQMALHGALMMRALRARDMPEVSQVLYEEIFAGFDHAYRQTGVGDSSISRKVRKLGEHFYGLARGLDQGLESQEDAALERFVARNGLAREVPDLMVSYLRRADKVLSQDKELSKIEWPTP